MLFYVYFQKPTLSVKSFVTARFVENPSIFFKSEKSCKMEVELTTNP